MKLRSVNLNLLLVFATVYRERSISNAARKLHLTQPTVSNAIARLREQLGDPLFERYADGVRPTPRARYLYKHINKALDLIEQGLVREEPFDYASSQRSFVIAMGDYGEAIFLSRLLELLAQIAPKVHIKIRPEPSAEIQSQLRDGQIDLALDYFALPQPEFVSKCLLTDTLISLARNDHPGIKNNLDLKTYLNLRHVILEPREGTHSLIDLALSKRNKERIIAATVPHFQSMPIIIKESELICTMPRRMANIYAKHFGLSSFEVPLRTPNFPIYLIWHHSLNEDPGHLWLRCVVNGFAQTIQ